MDSGSLELVNRKVLRRSVTFTILYTVFALAVGFLTSSQVILFDGVFNLVGVALTYLSIIAMKFIKKPDSWNYPFGKEAFEPFIAITQYFIILYICATNIITAVQVILDGGHAVNIASGVSYGIFAALFNIAVLLYLKQLTKRQSSAIAAVEIDQWKFSCLLSCGILVGFTLSWITGQTALAGFTAFVDPVLTILITLVFGKTAILAIKSCVREMLLATPPREIIDLVSGKLNKVTRDFQFLKQVLRVGKVGNRLIIELDCVIVSGSSLDSIDMQDAIRQQIHKNFQELPYEVCININFTGNESWCNRYNT